MSNVNHSVRVKIQKSLSSHTLAPTHTFTLQFNLLLVLCTCVSINSLRDVAISAVFQRIRWSSSPRERVSYSVIKVMGNRVGIHLGGSKVSGEHLENMFEAKTETKCFCGCRQIQGRGEEYRRAPSDDETPY